MSGMRIRGLESRWDQTWYGPVAAIRPFLVLRGFLLLVAGDAWLLLLRGGGSYGVGGFNVAHFSWLDSVQPLPTPASYTGIVLAAGGVALFAALTRPRRWLLGVLWALYTYGWCMSLLDMYQHHYLISVVLFHLVLFPRLASADIADGTRTSAWGYKLLGVTIAVVYAFTALAKLDTTWRSGRTLMRVDPSGALHGLFDWILTPIGVAGSDFYALAANLVIAVEIAIAAAYLVTLRLDESDAQWPRRFGLAGWGLAVSLHASFELLHLAIGIFSGYMILVASVYFLPESWLRALARVALAPSRALEPRIARVVGGRLGSRVAAGSLSAGVAAALVGIGATVDLPGAPAAAVAAGTLVAGAGIVGLARGRTTEAVRSALVALLCGLGLWLSVEVSPARSAFYEIQATGSLQRGALSPALSSLRKAREYWRGDRARLASIDTNLGALEIRQGRHEQALRYLREAIAMDPTSAAAHFQAGVALETTGDVANAARRFARASELDPLDVDARVRLAAALQRLGRPEEAAAELRRALDLAPRRADAWRRLAAALEAMGDGEALRHWERAVELAPDHFGARLRLADALLARGRADAAIAHLSAARRTRPDSSRVRTKLATALRARGRQVEAAAIEAPAPPEDRPSSGRVHP